MKKQETIDNQCRITSKEEAVFFAQTTVSRFGELYNPEDPVTAKNLVRSTIDVLSCLEKQGFDMSKYVHQVRDCAIDAEHNYTGESASKVHQSTLHVLDGIIYKAKTGYQKNKKRITEMFRKSKS